MQERAHVLLVEDNDNDVLLVRRTFSKAGVTLPIKVLKTAEEAMACLANATPYDNLENPAPALILLDLGLPGISGFELLQWIRKQPELKAVHVVVLTAPPASATCATHISLARIPF